VIDDRFGIVELVDQAELPLEPVVDLHVGPHGVLVPDGPDALLEEPLVPLGPLPGLPKKAPGEIHAFPSSRGVIPVVGIDGWARIINDHPQFDGLEFDHAPDEVRFDELMKPAPEWTECIIYRKDRHHPIKVREYLDEVYQPPRKNGSGKEFKGPWQTHTKRMLRHKAMIQAARLAFSFSGIYDQDEAERIQQNEPIDVTPHEPAPEPPPESRSEALKDQLRGRQEPPEFPDDMEQDDGEQGDPDRESGEGPGGEADEQQQSGSEPDAGDDEAVQGQ